MIVQKVRFVPMACFLVLSFFPIKNFASENFEEYFSISSGPTCNSENDITISVDVLKDDFVNPGGVNMPNGSAVWVQDNECSAPSGRTFTCIFNLDEDTFRVTGVVNFDGEQVQYVSDEINNPCSQTAATSNPTTSTGTNSTGSGSNNSPQKPTEIEIENVVCHFDRNPVKVTGFSFEATLPDGIKVTTFYTNKNKIRSCNQNGNRIQCEANRLDLTRSEAEDIHVLFNVFDNWFAALGQVPASKNIRCVAPPGSATTSNGTQFTPNIPINEKVALHLVNNGGRDVMVRISIGIVTDARSFDVRANSTVTTEKHWEARHLNNLQVSDLRNYNSSNGLYCSNDYPSGMTANKITFTCSEGDPLKIYANNKCTDSFFFIGLEIKDSEGNVIHSKDSIRVNAGETDLGITVKQGEFYRAGFSVRPPGGCESRLIENEDRIEIYLENDLTGYPNPFK